MASSWQSSAGSPNLRPAVGSDEALTGTTLPRRPSGGGALDVHVAADRVCPQVRSPSLLLIWLRAFWFILVKVDLGAQAPAQGLRIHHDGRAPCHSYGQLAADRPELGLPGYEPVDALVP